MGECGLKYAITSRVTSSNGYEDVAVINKWLIKSFLHFFLINIIFQSPACVETAGSPAHLYVRELMQDKVRPHF